jgi:hypothetical protein
VATEKKVVQLIGTEVCGVEQRDECWTTVTYTEDEPKPQAHDSLCGMLDGMKEEITEHVCQLTDLLARLRRLKVTALDGDEAAIEEAERILDDRSLLDDDDIWAMQGDVEALEELVEPRIEVREPVTVNDDTAIDTTIRDLALPFIKAGEHVVVRRHNAQTGCIHSGAVIKVQRYGHHVTITVFPKSMSWQPIPLTPLPPLGPPLDSAYERVVEAKGEAAARAILAAVQNVAKGDVKKQVELLRRAVAA